MLRSTLWALSHISLSGGMTFIDPQARWIDNLSLISQNISLQLVNGDPPVVLALDSPCAQICLYADFSPAIVYGKLCNVEGEIGNSNWESECICSPFILPVLSPCAVCVSGFIGTTYASDMYTDVLSLCNEGGLIKASGFSLIGTESFGATPTGTYYSSSNPLSGERLDTFLGAVPITSGASIIIPTATPTNSGATSTSSGGSRSSATGSAAPTGASTTAGSGSSGALSEGLKQGWPLLIAVVCVAWAML